MAVSSLGYVVIESTNIAKWRSFGTDVMGYMAGTPTNAEELWLRIDERPFRMVVVPGKTDRFVAAGWEFANRADFEAALKSLAGGGVTVKAGTAAQAAARCADAIAYCADPNGNQLELYYGRHYDYRQFISPAGVSGFVTGNMGLGHVVLPSPKVQPAFEFYTQLLGFALTDEMHFKFSPDPNDPGQHLYFLHADNPRHHSVALFEGPTPSGLVHMMTQAHTVDDVGYTLDRCNKAGYHITSSLGRHTNDLMLSFYVQTPGGFDIEFGCDGLMPDWKTFVPTRSYSGDLWGHIWSAPPPPNK